MTLQAIQSQTKGAASSGMMHLVGLFEELQSDRQNALRFQVKELLLKFPVAARNNRQLDVSKFNILSICGLGPDEVQHSSILAWLLDENASHGKGSAFFAALASIIGLKLNDAPKGYSVYAEFAGFESITDIVVYKTGDFYISIENKINACEGDDQLNREYRDREAYANSLNISNERRIAVFLTPDGRPPVTGNPKKWVSLSYPQIASAFNSIPYPESLQKLRFFVEDWTASIRGYPQ
jgi:hypothetical protein